MRLQLVRAGFSEVSQLYNGVVTRVHKFPNQEYASIPE